MSEEMELRRLGFPRLKQILGSEKGCLSVCAMHWRPKMRAELETTFAKRGPLQPHSGVHIFWPLKWSRVTAWSDSITLNV